MAFFLGVKRAAAFWAPQLGHVLRQVSGGLLLVLIGIKLGADYGRLHAWGAAPGFIGWIFVVLLLHQFLSQWESKRRTPPRSG